MQYWTSLLALAALNGAGASPLARGAALETRDYEYKTAGRTLDVKRVSNSPRSSRALLAERLATASSTQKVKEVEEGAGYAIEAELGGTTYTLIFDTGSSDLWVPKSDYQCVNAKGVDKDQSFCDFKETFAGTTFDEGKIKDENFNITYGDGEFVIGTLGYEKVKVGDYTVKKQEMALVSEAYFEGEGVAGIFGFAFPSLTSAYSGTDPAHDPLKDQVIYKDWIINAIKAGDFDPYFSLALERGPTGGQGYLALGGLPDISFNHTFATTPIEIKDLEDDPITAKDYSFYTILPDGLTLEGEYKATKFSAIVDSGTTLLYLPVDLAEDILAAYDPPAVYIEDEGVYEADCDATPPAFSIRIGGTDFTISPKDLIPDKELSYDSSTGGCVTGIQPEEDIFIFGDIFLKNVVAVYDIGKKEMKFAPHDY